MLTAPRPEDTVLGARPDGRLRGSLPALAGAAPGVVGALTALVVVSASATWGLVPAAQVPVDATVGIAFPVMAVVMLTAPSLGNGARALARVLLVAGACSGVAALATAVSLAAGSRTSGEEAAVQLAVQVAVQVQGAIWVPGFVPLLTLVPLLYPDGLLPGRAWRWAAGASVVGTLALTVGIGLYPETFPGQVPIPKPVTHLPAARALTVVGGAVLVPAVVVALASPVVRLVRSRGLRRRQVVVLLVAAGVLAVVTAAQGVLPTPVDVVAQAVAAGLVAVAIGVAVTRHGLYDLDTAVARALVATSLAVCLAGAYLTLFTVLQALPEHRSALSAALAAGLTGAVLQPLGRRLTTGVDRLFYGDRADPFAVTTELAARLTRTGLDVAVVPQVVCDTVVEALRLPGAQVRLAVDGSTPVVAAAGATEPPGAAAGFELRHRGDVVGRLEVWPRRGERVLDERDSVVVRGVADQVSPAVAALQLHRQLQRSREALVAAREDERLRLRRELHDGLGATLAGLRLQVETACDLTTDQDVSRLLESAGAGVTGAVAEVRAVTDGLRPAGIDELGLPRALAALADRVRVPGLDVRVEVDPQVRADPAVEVALHRIAGEALANAARHSGARHVALTVRDARGITLEVSDDGTGLGAGADTSGSGLGLASMQRRAEEVGGSFEVVSSGHGTTVTAVLPHSVGDL